MSPVEEAINRDSPEPNQELQLSPSLEEGIKMVNIRPQNLDTKTCDASPANRNIESWLFSRFRQPVSKL